jgi:hypothetical protein
MQQPAGTVMAATKQKKKVGRVMREYKRGELKSGSGRKVGSRKQAVAIAMSESGQSRKKKTSSTSRRTSTARRKSTTSRRKSTRKAKS